MTEFKIYKLTFQTPLHLSRGKIGSYESSETILHSDAIKSALYVAALQLDKKNFADKLLNELTVSSAFPFDKNECWLPRPVGFNFTDENAENRKELKKISFFSTKQFSAILNGEKNSEILDASKNKIKLWEREVTQRVWMNGNPNKSTPFYLEKLYPTEETGVYFIAYSKLWDTSTFKEFEGVLKLLGENGVGLQRNLGNGRFGFENSTMKLDLPQNAENWISLSLYRPTNELELNDSLEKKSTNYQFIKRGGWISSPEDDEHIKVRKKSVMMFTVGSVFAFGVQNENILQKGKSVNLKPDWDMPMNDIYRDGKAFFLPMKN